MQGSETVEWMKKLQQFLKLCNSEWSVEISSNALRTLHTEKFNKPHMLSLAEDVKLLHRHLEQKAETTSSNLSNDPVMRDWSDLCQVTLAQIVIFNTKQRGKC